MSERLEVTIFKNPNQGDPEEWLKVDFSSGIKLERLTVYDNKSFEYWFGEDGVYYGAVVDQKGIELMTEMNGNLVMVELVNSGEKKGVVGLVEVGYRAERVMKGRSGEGTRRHSGHVSVCVDCQKEKQTMAWRSRERGLSGHLRQPVEMVEVDESGGVFSNDVRLALNWDINIEKILKDFKVELQEVDGDRVLAISGLSRNEAFLNINDLGGEVELKAMAELLNYTKNYKNLSGFKEDEARVGAVRENIEVILQSLIVKRVIPSVKEDGLIENGGEAGLIEK